MSYESPIHIIDNSYDSITDAIEEHARRVAEGVDEMIVEACIKVGCAVDKDELVKALEYDRGQYEKGYADGKQDAAAAIEELQAQLPKRGEWEREMDVNDEPFYQCSVCGECFDFNSDSTHEVFNYCPNCGADMRKMEVQDGKRCD